MVLEEIEKSKFAQINDKRYYSSEGVVSLLFSHPFSKEIFDFKRKKTKKLGRFYNRKNSNLFKWKNLQPKKNKRISIYRSIIEQNPSFCHLNSLKRSTENNENINFSQNTRSYILNDFWK